MYSNYLELLRDELPRLRRQIHALKTDVDLLSKGGEILFAFDFSELYDYLTVDSETSSERPDSLLYDNSYGGHAARLMSFFESEKTGNILLLPPHAKELWGFVHQHEELKEVVGQINNRLFETLSDEQVSLIIEVAKDPTSSKFQTLSNLIPDAADELCVDIANLINKLLPNEAILRLERLVKSKKLILHMDPLLRSFGIIPPTSAGTDIDEILILLSRMNAGSVKRSRQNKINDCKALLFLRDANKMLESKNKRIVFLTRDKGIRKLAYELGTQKEFSIFNWPNAHDFIRTLPGLQYYLQLISIPNVCDRYQLLDEADEILGGLLRAVSESKGGITSDAPSIRKPLAELKKHFALRLSLSLRDIWTQASSLNNQRPETEASEFESSLQIILSSDSYRKLILEQSKSSMDAFFSSAVTFFITENLLHTEHADATSVFLKAGSAETVIEAAQAGVGIKVNFTDSTLASIVNDLNSPDTDTTELGRRISSTLYNIAKDASAAEHRLFMAFFCCSNRLWRATAQLLEPYLSSFRSNELKAESLYLLSFSKRRLAFENTHGVGFQILQDAFKFAQSACNLNIDKLNDPRLAMELGSCILQYHISSESSGRPLEKSQDLPMISHVLDVEKPSEVSTKSAIDILLHGLNCNPPSSWLKNALLNNLAYAFTEGYEVSLPNAVHYCEQIRAGYELLEKDPVPGLATAPTLRVNHTLILVDAAVAREGKRIDELRVLKDKLETTHQQEQLTGSIAKKYVDSINKLDHWIHELQGSELDDADLNKFTQVYHSNQPVR